MAAEEAKICTENKKAFLLSTTNLKNLSQYWQAMKNISLVLNKVRSIKLRKGL
jgi:hypothetical protein